MFRLRTLTRALALMTLAGAAQANYVDAQGREWLDMTQVNGRSWNEFNAVCQNDVEAAGACAGQLSGGFDLTGWTWANRAEVVGLIDSFITASGEVSRVAEMQSQNGHGSAFAWATALIAEMGETSSVGPNEMRTIGYMNGTDTVGFTQTGQLALICTGSPCGFESYVGAGVSAGVEKTRLHSGWFYRPAAQVPEPASVALVGLGLLGLALARRR